MASVSASASDINLVNELVAEIAFDCDVDKKAFIDTFLGIIAKHKVYSAGIEDIAAQLKELRAEVKAQSTAGPAGGGGGKGSRAPSAWNILVSTISRALKGDKEAC